jgi:glycosyltransferase involved in cell wall biosynthesis
MKKKIKTPQVKVSQCMIVKNEEGNIRRALSWGKGIVWEQIVVDTGSTDKTVEIAKEMGARVFHFDWCDDFSAAKNYAIEQASGEWIAFLDADEYFSKADARKIPDVLKDAEASTKKGNIIHALCTEMFHLNDEGKVFSVGQHYRIFRNMKELRYRNRIHESLQMTDGIQMRCAIVKNLPIMHTGYQQSIRDKKGGRNIPLLKRELEENPGNYDAWSYLGESFAGSGQAQEALSCMERVIEHGTAHVMEDRVNAAFAVWFSEASFLPDGEVASYEDKAWQYYEIFARTGIVFPDVEFYMGRLLLRLGKEADGVRFFERALEKLEQYGGSSPLKSPGQLELIYNVLQVWYKEQGNASKAVYYGTLSLRFDLYQEETLSTLLYMFKNDPNTTAEQVFGFLNGLYHFKNLKDKLFVLRTAMKIDYKELEEQVKRSLSEEELGWLEAET